MKKILFILALIVSSIGFSQDVLMQNGTFNRCAPDKFFDSGGEFGNYSNSENFVTTICPQNADEFTILDFTTFFTQLDQDIITIYDGDDTSADVLGTWSGPNSPGTVSASDTNTSGCLTIEFVSNDSGPAVGWEADILCATACQDIVASIDSTVPAANGSGVISILPGETVDFSGSATFSQDGTNATYNWDFGDGNMASGTDVSNTFLNFGTYTVTLTVEDDNPQICSDTETIIVFVLGPNVVVDQDTYTSEQLIEDVLINSPCATVSNIISSTGTDFSPSEPNGIGYFVSNGTDFPFEDGILLTSGDASRAGGPNNVLLGDGTGVWPGDADLEAAIAGVDSNNASYIQFDFTPLANEISFEFLMASEEYDMGGFECQFSDAFAFLLTDSMGNTTNLAVLPGTTTPILVTNIHPDNGSCGAANPQYFGEYTPFNGPPISFDGRTAVFTAQSAVVPGENYTIKLVVADDRDTIYDTAVFIKARSFNLGGSLGRDYTIAAGTAQCDGTEVTLDTDLNTANHVWYKDDVVIPDEISSTLVVTEPGVYFAEIDFAGVCEGETDPIVIEFRSNPIASDAENLVICSTDGTIEFDLTENDDDVLGSQNADDFVITYHLTEQDAMDNIGALSDNYTNIENPQTIWARIADTSQVCFDTTSFQLSTSGTVIENALTPISLCDDALADGIRVFNLADREAEIIGSNNPDEVTISYHLTLADAEDNIAPLSESYMNAVPNSQTIFVRLEFNANTNCYATAPLLLEVLENPIANMAADFELCDDNQDGRVEFDLSLRDGQISGSQVGVSVTYHLTEEDADLGMSALPTLYTNADAGSQVIHARIENDVTGCYDTTTLQLTVHPLPDIVSIAPYELCDYNNSGNLQELFDLSTKDGEILNGQTGVSVTYHLTMEDAEMDANALATMHTAITSEIYVRLENNMTGCYNTTVLQLVVNPLPLLVVPTPLEVCDDGTPDGITGIDLNLKNGEISGNNSGYSVSYYLTQNDADLEIDPLGIPYTNTMNGQIVYVRVEDVVTGCYDTTTLELVVEQAPVANTPDPLRYCDPDNDGTGLFMLTDADNGITGGDTSLTVSYHVTMANAENDADAIDTSIAYMNIEDDQQTLYARVESSTIATDCATIVELELIVEPTPQIVDPEPLEECDDPSADGFALFDLTGKAGEVLNGLDGTQYVVSYYESEANAELASNPIANPGAYTNIEEGGQLVWIRVEDSNTVEGCYKVTSLELIVHPLPVLTMPMPFELCDVNDPGDEREAFDLGDVSAEILNGLPGVTITYYESQLDAENATDAISGPYTNLTTAQTIYVRGEDNDTGCYSTTTLTILVNPVPTPTSSDQIPDIELCDDVNTGDGLELFDLRLNENLVLNGENATVTYYETFEDADSGENPIMDPDNYTNASTPEQEIYVRVAYDVTGCYSLVDFTIRVNPLPDVVAVTDLIQCELNTDGFDSFELTTKDAEVLNGQDPSQYVVSYHSDLADAESGTNALVSPYTNISNPQRIYVTITDTSTGCSISTQSFDLQVDEGAEANPDMDPILYEQCDDNMETDGDPGNDSTQFDLSTRDSEVLDGQAPASYMVSYYATEEDANQNVNPLPNLYENIVNPQVIYARVDNNTLSVTPIFLDLAALGTTGLDLDIDGTIDTYDTDGDGVFDLIDVDGDGLSDGIDTDGDGVYEFVDVDGDGTGDPVDLDNDGMFNNQQDGSICFAVAALTLQVNPLPNFDLDESYILCVNTNGTEVLGPLELDTGLSETDYTFEWSYNGEVLPGETGSTLSPTQGGTYGVMVTDIGTSLVTQCVNMDTTEVIESEPPMLMVDVLTQGFAENHVIEAVATGMGVYEYRLDGGPWQDSGTFTGVSPGYHQVTARDRNGCGMVTVDDIFILDYPRYFTPNGDGENDTWNIAGIGSSAKIYIFDRYGKLLKQLNPDGPGWDGTFNGNRMPTSGYWFTVEYDEESQQGTVQRKQYRAHFTLKR